MANTVYGSIVIKEKGVLRTKKDNATFRLHLGHNVSEYDLWNNSFPDQIRICKLGSGLETVEILIQFRNTPSPCVIYDREIHINKKNDLLELKKVQSLWQRIHVIKQWITLEYSLVNVFPKLMNYYYY